MFWNQTKTAFLLGMMSALLFLLGHLIGGMTGMYFALVLAVLLNGIIYFFSDKMVLTLYRAQPLDQKRYAFIYDMVHELADSMHIPMPKMWYVATPLANAFATGRSPAHASIAVTQGILDILEPHELRGVLAHELSHVKNRDVLVGTIAATMAMAIGYIADMFRWAAFFGGRSRDRDTGPIGALIIAILMPIAALLIQLAISRSREYLADETGARCCHDPLALAAALEKIQYNVRDMHLAPQSGPQATAASLFIVYPYIGRSILNLFSTHPPVEKRIARLRKMVIR